ncbi:hypothetical protein [Belliella pelovolcani]|uniref:hypothetical protein n=1 Tax=Belliella pelovolcani TaxID=529505 RepID=UPI00391C9B01
MHSLYYLLLALFISSTGYYFYMYVRTKKQNQDDLFAVFNSQSAAIMEASNDSLNKTTQIIEMQSEINYLNDVIKIKEEANQDLWKILNSRVELKVENPVTIQGNTPDVLPPKSKAEIDNQFDMSETFPALVKNKHGYTLWDLVYYSFRHKQWVNCADSDPVEVIQWFDIKNTTARYHIQMPEDHMRKKYPFFNDWDKRKQKNAFEDEIKKVSDFIKEKNPNTQFILTTFQKDFLGWKINLLDYVIDEGKEESNG